MFQRDIPSGITKLYRGQSAFPDARLETRVIFVVKRVCMYNYRGYSQYNWACLKTANKCGILVEGGHGSVT
jgi:hypothetical protein